MKKPQSPRERKKQNDRHNTLMTRLVNRCLRIGQGIAPGASMTQQIITGAARLSASGQITKREYTDVVAAAKHIRTLAAESLQPT